MPKFTQEQIVDFYQHVIVSQDPELMTMLAQAAIDGAADTRADMWAERDTPIPDENDVRQFAHSFTNDMIVDFRNSLLAAINAQKFAMHLRLLQNTKFIE